MVIFIICRVQVYVGRLALTLNVIMTIILNAWMTYQWGSLQRPSCKNENSLLLIRKALTVR